MEVAELKKVSWLEIVGLVDVRSLEVKTSYSAFLVFKIQGGSKELERATASVRFTKEITDGVATRATACSSTRRSPAMETRVGFLVNGAMGGRRSSSENSSSTRVMMERWS